MRIRIDIRQMKRVLVRLPRRMGENIFFGFLLLFSLALLISSFVFYQYVFSTRDADVATELIQTKFDEQTFQKVRDIWEKRTREFQNAGQEPMRDIFAPSPPAAEQSKEELTGG